MSKTVLMLLAGCVGLGLLSLHLIKQMRSGQATIAELQAQLAKLESERQAAPPPSQAVATARIEPSIPSPPPARSNVFTALSALRSPDASAPPPRPSQEERMRMFREAHERQQQLMRDPEYRDAMRVQLRGNMTRQYPGLAQELGLNPEQTDQLFDLLAEQQMRVNERAEMMWDAEGLDAAAMQQRQEKMQQRWMEMQKRNDAELAAKLGPAKLQAWKDYQSTLGARHQAEQLRVTLAGRGVPLDEEAGKAVINAYAEAQKAEMQEYANMARANASSSGKSTLTLNNSWTGPSPEMHERQLELTKKRQQRVLDALSPFLSYEQREAVQKEQEAELKMQEAQIRMMRAQSSTNGTGGVDWIGGSGQTSVLVPVQ